MKIRVAKKLRTLQILAIFILIIAMFPVGVFAATQKAAIEVDGVAYEFTLDGDTKEATLTKVKNPSSERSVTLPSSVEYEGVSYSVKTININTFSGEKCPNITSLSIPNSVSLIKGSFNSFRNVKSISIPGSVKLFQAQFQNCTGLESITFEEGVETIECNSMLYGLENLTSVKLPSSLKKLEGPVFTKAVALKTLDLPANVEMGSNFSFSGCAALEKISLPDTVTAIPGSCFSGCSSLTSVTAKSPITSIGRYAFYGCKSLTEIPDLSKVSTMKENAFDGCKALSCDIDLSSLNEIPDSAFRYTRTTVTKFSDSLSSIGSQAFVWNKNTSVDFPDTLESIGDYAFYGAALKGTVDLPDSVTSLGTRAFAYTDITEFNIGSGLTEISKGAFDGDSGAPIDTLKKITFNNSEDNMSGTSNLPKGVEIVYLQESIGDVGDTISDEPGAMTLQEAVNESKPGDTIVIKKHVKLPKTLIIPAGKDVTIKSEGYSILGEKDNNLRNLINVQEDGAVTFADVKISGKYNSENVIDSKGKVTINEGTVISDSYLAYSGGIIKASGKNASVTINGGTIKNNVLDNQLSGVVNISNNASFLMTGGKITGNKVKNSNAFNSSAGLYMTSGATGKMTGGEISENKAFRGSAVMLYSIYGTDKSNRVSFEMTGGEISGNVCKNGDLRGSGALHIEGNAEAKMTGGKITGNTGIMGAGVCAADYGLQSGDGEMKTEFILDGGEISGNKGWTGAGVYSYTNGVKLLSGKIINNTAENHGGGVYSEGNSAIYSNMFIDNALVTNNTAEQGGGLWFCPTGTANIRAEDEMVVFDNKATGAGDDFVSASKMSGYAVTLPDRLKSGDRIYWYEDGGVRAAIIGGNATVPSIIDNAPRYGEAGASTTPISVKSSSKSYALKAITDPTAKKIAADNCTLLISGNKAAQGGGIAANGGVNDTNTIYSKQELVVKKVWDDGGNPEGFAKDKPESVKFTLVIDGRRLDSVELNEDNNWTQSFYDISSDIPLDKIAVSEEEIPGFAVSYSEPTEDQGEITITATNTYAPETGSLAVSKKVEGSNKDKEKAFKFSVTLDDKNVNGTYGEMVFKDGVSTFTLKHGQRVAATGLPAGVSYTVKELNSEGYTVKVKGDKSGKIEAKSAASVEFTNFSNVPDEADTGDNSNLIMGMLLLLMSGCGIAGTVYLRRKNLFTE